MRAFLEGLELGRYLGAFEENDIDEATLATLTDADLVELGVRSLGHRKRILRALEARSASASGIASRADLRPGQPTEPSPSRRAAESGSEHGTGLTHEAAEAIAAEFPRALAAALAARGYVVIDRIGRGGMGEVFLARQTTVERDVAIKVLPAGVGPAERTRFLREARAVAALQHPHVVRLFDFVVSDEGGACIVMEHLVGQSLGALYAHEGRVPAARMLSIAVQICDALSEAHAKGIVHRDLKPQNVLLQEAEGYRDFARVLDFGLAHWLDETGGRLTRTGAVHGTPRYLSPEQIVGSAITPRSDLYALGVMLYEGLAGRPPFTGEIDAALLYRHVKEVAPSLPDDVERPAGLDSVLARLLAKSPGLRPASAAAVRRELSALAAADPGGSRRIAVVGASATPSAAVAERRPVVTLVLSFLPRGDASSSPELVHTLSRRAQTIVEGVARRRGATITARSGHGATLVFGAPIARKGDLSRALDAALELRAALTSLDTARARVRIGLAEGAAISGSLHEGPDAGYFVSGEPVDAAEGLHDAAGTGEIRIGPSVVSREPPGFTLEVSEEGTARLLGRGDSTSSHALPFVGRAAELEVAHGVLAGIGPGTTGAVLVITGEAGIGKSRLVDRIVSLAADRGVRSARGALYDVEVAEHEDALHQIVRDLLSIPDDVSDRVAAIERRLGPDALLIEQWPFLYHYLGIALPGPMQRLFDAMEPSARASGYRDVLVSLLAHESRSQPLLVVVEDLQWADDAMLEVVELAASSTDAHPIVLVLTSQIEDEERWRHVLLGRTPTRIELGALSPEDARALAVGLGVPEANKDALASRAGGHPLLLTELARRATDSSDVAVPDSLRGLIQARIDRLPDIDRAAIAIAAVLAPRWQLVPLRVMLGEPDYHPTTLTEHRLVKRENDGALSFAHAMVRDVVYGSLLEERRCALHRRAAEVLHAHPALAAMHLERAGAAEAAGAFLAAARQDVARHALGPARDHAIRGLALARSEDERRALLAMRAGVELTLGDAAAALASYESLRALGGTAAEVQRAELGLAEVARAANRWAEALAALDRVEAAGHGEPIAIARARYMRGGIEFARGRLDASREAHEDALARATAAGALELRTQALSGLADAHYGAGRLVSAAETWEECVRVARAEKFLAVEAANLPMLAIVRVFLGEPLRARTTADEAIALARSLSRVRSEAIANGGAALAAASSGAYSDALLYATRGLEIVERLGHTVFLETVLFYLALAQLGLGERDAARASIDRALDLARRHGMQFVGATLLAMVARLAEDRAERERALMEGEALARGKALSFDRFWFFQHGIEAALADRAWSRVREYAAAITETAEPLEGARLLAARARALADHGEGRGDGATVAALEGALASMREAGLDPDTRALEEALSESSTHRPTG